MSKYIELIQESAEESQLQEKQFQAKNAELQLQADILATEQSVFEAEEKLRNAKKAIPFNSQAIVDAQVNLEAANDALKRLKALQKELF